MTPSIKDVAQLAGCSTATVSRVLAGKGYISENARKKVEEAVRELGYRPNRIARSLRAQKSRVIGLVLSDIRNPFFSEISRAVEKVAFQQGYNVLICNTDEDSSREEHYLKLLEEEQVAGILLSPTRHSTHKLNTVTAVPLVLFDRKFPKSILDSVIIDNEAAAQSLANTLIAGGFKRIAGIFGARSYTASGRVTGFKSAFKDREHLMAGTHQIDAFEEEGNRLTKKLLSDSNPPDALLCSSALLATGAFRAIKELKLRVPDEIGFACFDDPSWATFVDPPVTTIRQPAQAIGESAAELLMKRIEAPDRPVSEITLRGELILRASSGEIQY